MGELGTSLSCGEERMQNKNKPITNSMINGDSLSSLLQVFPYQKLNLGI
jgi:hypothetical protein